MIPLLLATFWLGGRWLTPDVIWGDEYHSIFDAGGATFGPLTPSDIWQRVAERNPFHTPGYFWLLNGWGQFVGWSAPALRAFALLVGLLGLAWTYRLGRDVVSPRTGFFAAVSLGTSGAYIYYTHEIRMYILFIPLTAFVLWAYLRIISRRREPDALAYLSLLVGSVASLYIHYFATLPLMAIGVYHLFVASFAGNWKRWLRVILVMLVAGILFLPWVGALVRVIDMVSEPSLRRAEALGALATTRAVAELFSSDALALLAVTLALAVIAAVTHKPTRRVWFFALATGAFALAVNAWLRLVYYDARVRYLFAWWVPLALLVGAGLAYLSRRGRVGRVLSLALLGVWVGVGVWYVWFNSDNNLDLEGSDLSYPMHQVAAAVDERAYPGDVVVNYLPDQLPAWRYGGISDYYFDGMALEFRVLERRWNPGEQSQHHREMMGTLTDKTRVWLAHMTNTTPTALADFQGEMSRRYGICETVTSTTAPIQMTLYARAPVCCASASGSPPPVLVDYGNWIKLSGVNMLGRQPDGTQPMFLAWAVSDAVPPEKYSVALHILDAAGEIVAQADYGLPRGAFVCEGQTLDLSTLSPGDYWLNVIVYDWQTGDRLTGTLTGSGEQGERLPVVGFKVDERPIGG